LARKHKFFEISVEGLDEVFNQLVSYSKELKYKSERVIKGINANSLNRKIHARVKNSMEEQNINTGASLTKYMIRSFSVRQRQNKDNHKVFTLFNPILDGRAGKQKVTKTSKGGNSWSITYKGILSMFMYGRKKYKIPAEGNDSAKTLVWKDKKTGKKIVYDWRKYGRVQVPAFRGVNYFEYIENDIYDWMMKIQEKFLNMKV
jgi:hypothetical protein